MPKKETSTFPLKENISSEELAFDNSAINYPFGLLIIDTLLFVDDQSFKALFQAYDLKRQKFIKTFGTKGDGVGEFRFHSLISKISKNETLGINNRTVFSFSELNIDNILNETEISPISFHGAFSTDYSKIIQIKENLFAGIGLFRKRVALSDSTGRVLAQYGSYPFEKELEGISHYNLGMAYQGTIKSRPSGTHIVVGTTYAANFDIYLIDGDSLKLQTSSHLWPPIFESSDDPNLIQVKFTKDNRNGYLDITVTDDFIYLLFSGRSKSKYGSKARAANDVFIYDWLGKPVAHLVLDQDVRVIAVDEANTFMLAAGHDESPNLYKYELKQESY